MTANCSERSRIALPLSLLPWILVWILYCLKRTDSWAYIILSSTPFKRQLDFCTSVSKDMCPDIHVLCSCRKTRKSADSACSWRLVLVGSDLRPGRRVLIVQRRQESTTWSRSVHRRHTTSKSAWRPTLIITDLFCKQRRLWMSKQPWRPRRAPRRLQVTTNLSHLIFKSVIDASAVISFSAHWNISFGRYRTMKCICGELSNTRAYSSRNRDENTVQLVDPRVDLPKSKSNFLRSNMLIYSD